MYCRVEYQAGTLYEYSVEVEYAVLYSTVAGMLVLKPETASQTTFLYLGNSDLFFHDYIERKSSESTNSANSSSLTNDSTAGGYSG